jgi:hypothetical protein
MRELPQTPQLKHSGWKTAGGSYVLINPPAIGFLHARHTLTFVYNDKTGSNEEKEKRKRERES